MWQFLKFAIVGGFNTVVDFAVLNILIVATGITAGVGFSIFKGVSFSAAVLNSYILNKNWTFKDKSKTDTSKFSQFIYVSLIGLAINVGAASLIVNGVEPIMPLVDLLNYGLGFIGIEMSTGQAWANMGVLMAVAVSLIWNFFGYKLFVFKKSEETIDKA